MWDVNLVCQHHVSDVIDYFTATRKMQLAIGALKDKPAYLPTSYSFIHSFMLLL